MAYTLTKADVTAIAAELGALDDVRWALPLAAAQARCSNSDAFGGDANAKLAATWLAAHLATIELRIQQNPRLADGGPVLEVRVGPVARTYDSLASLLEDGTKAFDPSLGLTRYGIVFRGFQRSFSFARFVVT